MNMLRSLTAREIIFAMIAVALVALVAYGVWTVSTGAKHEWKPHEMLSAAIFFGALCIAQGLGGIADALKDRARSYNETPESKAIKELAKAVESLSRK